MSSSAGFSIASSPPGAIGGLLSSPNKSGRQNTPRKPPTAAQLLDQIRQLEAEGNKLRSETAGAGGPSMFNALTDLNMSDGNDKHDLPKFTSTSPKSLSALVDYSAEQKTISELRQQLEKQRKETEKLNTQIHLDGFGTSRSGPSSVLPGSPSKTGFSTLPSTELFGSRRPASVTGAMGAMETGPPSHLEKSLKDSQEQVADLRKRLMESSEQGESQKRQFRMTVEDLKAKLQDTMANRDSMMELRQKEVSTLESKIIEQATTIRELQSKLKIQEQALSETTRKADGYSRENFVSETTLSQVRLILVDAERRRGRAYFESDPASAQAPSMLVHTLERCIQEMLKDLEIKKSKVEELERDLQELKQSQSTDQNSLSFEYQQKITQMTTDHEKQMLAANERANNARKQATSLESQLSTIQGQHAQQLKLKEDTVTELENKIRHLREELHEERDKYSSKREHLEHTLHDTEKEMSKLRTERDEATRNHANMESKVADLQLTINRLQRDLDTEKENGSRFWDREGQLRGKQAQLETRLEEKTRDVERLESLLSSVKQECSATVTEKVSMIERQERDRHMEKISSLTQQLSEVSEKCNRLSLELDNTRAENKDLRQQSRETTDRADTTKVQFEAAVAERKHMTDMLTAKTSDFDRVSQERDYYFNIMDQKNNELTQLKSQKERLTIQLEEREKNVGILQEQVTSLQQMIESTSRNSESVREERDVLIQQLQETTHALEELKSSKDNMAKKMKIREKRLRELESEKQKNSETIDLRNKEMKIIQQEKETLFKELKESRYEVASLTEERDGAKKELEGHKYQLEKSISKLQYRLKSTEQDLAMAQKALRKRESVDNSAVKMADKMQKEVTAKRSLVDTLQSKIRWYQDQVDGLLKDKSSLESDKDKLKSSLNKALVQNQQLMVDVETGNSRSAELKQHVAKIEGSLEKAAVRNASSQAQVEMFEQEMTRMKLAHQLEMKEALQKASSQYRVDRGEGVHSERGSYNPASVQSPRGQGNPSVPYSNTAGTAPPQNGQGDMQPQNMAQQDRLQAQKSGENYKEIGSELKVLLSEMRNLISEKQSSPREPEEVKQRSRKVKDKDRQRSRPQQKTRPVNNFPNFPTFQRKNPAFIQYRVPPAPSDISYYSDGEADDRVHNRSRSAMGTYALYSPEDKRKKSSNKKHRRSKSAEASFTFPRDSSMWTDSDYRTSDYRTSDHSPPAPESDVTEDADPIPLAAPDTHEICKRLEERIMSLTRMGDNLKKENKEMADLMKNQGKKLKKVKEAEKKIRKTNR